MPKFYESGEQLQQIILDYGARTDGQPDYMGFADRGALTSEGKWIIHKFSYTGDPGNMLTKRVAIGIWNDRASLF